VVVHQQGIGRNSQLVRAANLGGRECQYFKSKMARHNVALKPTQIEHLPVAAVPVVAAVWGSKPAAKRDGAIQIRRERHQRTKTATWHADPMTTRHGGGLGDDLLGGGYLMSKRVVSPSVVGTGFVGFRSFSVVQVSPSSFDRKSVNVMSSSSTCSSFGFAALITCRNSSRSEQLCGTFTLNEEVCSPPSALSAIHVICNVENTKRESATAMNGRASTKTHANVNQNEQRP
jgi:hypothetical protein